MKKAFALAMALSVFGAASPASTIGEIFAFGDSLNDCCVNPAAPFTNGDESWLVRLAGLLGATYADSPTFNFATGGAQSGQYNAIAPGGVKEANGLLSQMAGFLAAPPSISAGALAVIWVGTNDIWTSSYASDTLFGVPGLDIVRPLGPNPAAGELADHVAGNIRQAVRDLRGVGFDSVLLLTPYDIGNSALFDVPAGPAQNAAYSEALRDRMLTLHTPGIDTYVLDTVALIRGLQAGSPDNGFTELGTAPSCSFGAILCEERTQEEQDSFIFYDFVHLTTATNTAVALAAAELLRSGTPLAAIPLPAASALYLGALFAGFFALRRRGPRAFA